MIFKRFASCSSSEKCPLSNDGHKAFVEVDEVEDELPLDMFHPSWPNHCDCGFGFKQFHRMTVLIPMEVDTSTASPGTCG